MPKDLIVSVILCVLTLNSAAQTANEAQTQFEQGNYSEALAAYEHLLKRRPKDPLYNFRAGICAYRTNDMEKAIARFELAGIKYPLRNFYLGSIYFDKYQFEKAVAAYTAYLSSLNTTDDKYAETALLLNKAKLGANLINRIENIEIVDSMVVDKAGFLSKIVMTPELGTLQQQRVNLGDSTRIDIIHYTTQRGDRRYNSEYLEGNSNLFSSLRRLDGWDTPQPLTELNTPADENYPFLLQDGVTLYFASNDKATALGGYDIFITRLNTSNNTFLKPENIGMPFNSPFNDYMLVIDETYNTGWFASDRYLPDGKVAIYRFIPNREKKIVRSENPDSLIRCARIDSISEKKTKRTSTKVLRRHKNALPTPETAIFINNATTYTDTDAFKSNVARNHYFQVQKLIEEKLAIENQLIKLREDYRTQPNAHKDKNKEQILQLEKRLRQLPTLIKHHTKQMRNNENL